MTADVPSATSNSRTRRRRRFLFGVLFVICAGFVYSGVLDLLNIYDDLEAGQERLDGLDLDTVRRDGIDVVLDDAAAHLDAADRRAASSPMLRALSPLPFFGDQVAGVRALTGAAATLGTEAQTTGATIRDAIDQTSDDPRSRIDLLDTVLDEMDRIEAVAAETEIDAPGLVGPLQDAKDQVEEGLDEIPDRFATARTQVGALRDLLTGPSTYLVLAGNNAEMRPGAGMPLSAGAANFVDGDLALSEFVQTVARGFFTTPDGGSNAGPFLDAVSAPYPNWQIGVHPTATAVVANFPLAAPLQANIALDAVGFEPDGVVQLDAYALSSILGVIGPVTIDGREYNAENTPQLVLNQAYIDFDDATNAERYDAQGDLAQRVFDAIETRDVDLLDLVAALQDAAVGRNFMVWSRDPVIQELYDSLGISGRISGIDTMVSLSNTGANKLDWYVQPEVVVQTTPLATDEWLVTMSATVVHPERERTVDYIEGIRPELAGGQYRGMVLFQLPGAATDIGLEGGGVSDRGFDGTNQVIGTRVIVPKGEEHTVVATFRLPRDQSFLRIIPAARTVPTPYTYDGVTQVDDAPFAILFGDFPDRQSAAAQSMQRTAGFLAVGTVVFAVVAGRQRRRRDVTDDRRRALTRVDRRTTAVLASVALLLWVAAGIV